MADARLRVPIAEASSEQLLRAVYRQNVRMEKIMSDLSSAVTDLQGAVDGVASRLLPQIDALESANELLATSLADAIADDEAAAAALAEAQEATAAIRGQVEELNAIGAEPVEEPVEEEAPVEEPLSPEPALPEDEEAGVPAEEPTVEPTNPV